MTRWRSKSCGCKGWFGVLQLPRHSWQSAGPGDLPAGDGSVVAAGAAAPQSALSSFVGSLRATHGSLHPQTSDPAPAPQRPLLRQTPEVRAVCGNAARTDLCGGPPARAVPTATAECNSALGVALSGSDRPNAPQLGRAWCPVPRLALPQCLRTARSRPRTIRMCRAPKASELSR